jgi:short subunit dehydrogenase-like uncharacterized protein
MGERRVVLYGAAGHTGRFIAAELNRRGFEPVLAGRDLTKISPVAARYGAESKQVDATDAAGLVSLFAEADAVINAAGPFADTSPYLIAAALRERIPYLDVTAEPFVAKDLFETFDEPARKAGSVVAPAFGFFGALGDLLVTAALGDWTSVDTIELAFALDLWRPTKGTRLAGERRAGRRLVRCNGQLEIHEPTQAPPKGSWKFDAPFGEQPTVGEFSTVDVITISRHVRVDHISTWINQAPLTDLASADPSGPKAVDESGRSAQQFTIEAVVHRGDEHRHAFASGQDIYAVTAPLVVEAVARILDGHVQGSGALTAGQLFDARDFLSALSPEPLSVGLTDNC